jgi:hypothetical protein
MITALAALISNALPIEFGHLLAISQIGRDIRKAATNAPTIRTSIDPPISFRFEQNYPPPK